MKITHYSLRNVCKMLLKLNQSGQCQSWSNSGRRKWPISFCINKKDSVPISKQAWSLKVLFNIWEPAYWTQYTYDVLGNDMWYWVIQKKINKSKKIGICIIVNLNCIEQDRYCLQVILDALYLKLVDVWNSK